MSKYFNYFPKILYSANNQTTSLDTITNIITRFSFEETLKENSAVFYKYDIQESDTPEIIAQKFYNHPEKHWIVLLFNNIIDPQWDWPLDTKTLNEYIDTKYSANNYADTVNTSVSGLSWASSANNIHSYYKVITTSSFEKTVVQKLEVDSNTYSNNIIMQNGTTSSYTLNDGTSITKSITKETKTYYTYELEENEKKRTIKLIKPDYIPFIEDEFRRVIA